MSHSSEYSAFKNNRTKPFAKIAEGTDHIPSNLTFIDSSGASHETIATQTPAELELGRIGISALRRDPNGVDNINPHEAENRADIAAQLHAITLPYIQAARLEVPNASENKRTVFGNLKDDLGTTPEIVATCTINGGRTRKVTRFNYRCGKESNKLLDGRTTTDNSGIYTRVVFDESEKVTDITCKLPGDTSTDGVPDELHPLVAFKKRIVWDTNSYFEFSLSNDTLGGKIYVDDTYHARKPEYCRVIVYNSVTNMFDIQSDTKDESITPEEFIDLIAACINFTPLASH